MNHKSMIITGARKGIGRHLAEYYCDNGYQVLGCSRKESDFRHDHYHHFELDITDERAVRNMVTTAAKRCGQIDMLLNNAGIAALNHTLLTPLAAARKVFETNFMGTFLLSREVAKVMQRKEFGRIVNFTTVARPLNLEGEAVYAASKSAVESFTKILAGELGKFGITVNAIGPTPIRTDLIKAVPEDKLQQLITRQALKRFGEFSDVTNVIDFFLREESNFVTGQVLYLGGVRG